LVDFVNQINYMIDPLHIGWLILFLDGTS